MRLRDSSLYISVCRLEDLILHALLHGGSTLLLKRLAACVNLGGLLSYRRRFMWTVHMNHELKLQEVQTPVQIQDKIIVIRFVHCMPMDFTSHTFQRGDVFSPATCETWSISALLPSMIPSSSSSSFSEYSCWGVAYSRSASFEEQQPTKRWL